MFKKIVVGVDFTPTSERAVGAAVDLARATHGSVVLVHVVSVGSELRGATTSQPSVRPAMETRLAEYATSLTRGTGLTVEYGVVDGDEAGELARYVVLWGGDVLVVGTAGRTGVKAMMQGSVAAGVVQQSTVPVLIIGPLATV